MKLAHAVGLDVASVRPSPLPDGDLALLVERFDRRDGRRLHQEDLCHAAEQAEATQAMTAAPKQRW